MEDTRAKIEQNEVSNANSRLGSVDNTMSMTVNGNASIAGVETEDRLMPLLRKSLDMTVAKCISRQTVQWLFQKTYPEVAKKHPKALAGIHKQYVDNLNHTIKTEIDTMFEEEKVVDLVTELEQMASSTTETKKAWRPSGAPSEDIRAHLMTIKQKQRSKLMEILAEEEAESEQLQKLLAARRKNLARVHMGCQEYTLKLEQAAADLPSEELCAYVQHGLHLNNNMQLQ